MAWLTRTERAFRSVSRTLLESEVIFAKQDAFKTLCLISSTPDLVDVPDEFTMAFWVRPQVLSSINYFLNAFNRIYVYS